MRFKTLMWAIVFFVLPATVIAQNTKEELIQELYGKSGMEKQIEQLPLLLQVGFDQAVAADDRLKALTRSVLGEMRSSIKMVFAPENFKKTIVGECRNNLSADDLKSILGWLNSPIGRKFTHLEESASTPEKYIEMQRFASQLQKTPPEPERVKLLQQLDSAVKATETNVEVTMNTQLAITIAIASSLPKEQQPDYDNLVAAIEQTRPLVEDAMRNQTLVYTLYTYRSVLHAELRQYIAFASSPAGTKYHNVIISGLKKALLEGAYKWGESIADIIKQSEGKSEA